MARSENFFNGVGDDDYFMLFQVRDLIEKQEKSQRKASRYVAAAMLLTLSNSLSQGDCQRVL